MTEIVSKRSDIQPLKCLIVDDESIAVRGISNYIKKISFLVQEDSCSSAAEAVEILKRKEIDLMFLDISMPHMTGIELLETLENVPLTIIATTYSEFAIEGYRLNVTDYLLKPYSFERFSQAVHKAREIFMSHIILQNCGEDYKSNLFIRQGDSFKRISWEEILYAEAMQNYLKLYFKGKTIVIHQKISSLEELLPYDYFFRIHRSFLVNISHIDSLSGGYVNINGRELPLSKQRKVELLKSVVLKNLISK